MVAGFTNMVGYLLSLKTYTNEQKVFNVIQYLTTGKDLNEHVNTRLIPYRWVEGWTKKHTQ